MFAQEAAVSNLERYRREVVKRLRQGVGLEAESKEQEGWIEEVELYPIPPAPIYTFLLLLWFYQS
jgi:hypothetical protein